MSSKPFRFLEADPAKRPPNYASRAAQRKLMMLVGALFVVLIAMQQVGRPESWKWLEAMDQANKSQGENAATVTTRNQVPSPMLLDTMVDWIPSAGELTAAQLQELVQLEKIYWDYAVGKLEPDQQVAMVEVLGRWSAGRPVDLDNSVAVSGFGQLVRLRQQFRDQVKQQAALSATVTQQVDSNESQQALPTSRIGQSVGSLYTLPPISGLEVAQVVEDHSRWLVNQWERYPGVRSLPVEDGQETDGTGDDASAAATWRGIIQRWIDPVLLSQIQDGTRLGRPEERAVWLRFLQRASQNLPAQESVTRQNLMGQSEQFRGQWVSIQGTLRRLESRKLSEGVSEWVPGGQYLVAWIQPGIAGQGPYCVYLLNDPSLQELAKVGQDQRRGISVSGMFFKVFPYATSQTETTVGPVLIAWQSDLVKVKAATATRPPSGQQWGMIVGAVAGLAALLGAMAWYSTRYRTANPIGQRLYRTGKVQWLDDSSIDSIGESLQKLADQSGDLDPAEEEQK